MALRQWTTSLNTRDKRSQFGGTCSASSHRHLRITPGEWDAFMDDVAQTLDKCDVHL